jgi:hypothetical protein
MTSRTALTQKRKPRHAGGDVFALREQSVQRAPPCEPETGEAEAEKCERGGFGHTGRVGTNGHRPVIASLAAEYVSNENV